MRVIVITGAAAGVGRAIAREFGKEKAKIGLIARSGESLDAAKKEIELMGQAIILPLDVARAAAVEKAASTVEKYFGPSMFGSIMLWYLSFLLLKKCLQGNRSELLRPPISDMSMEP